MSAKTLHRAGFTLVEVLIGMVILALVALHLSKTGYLLSLQRLRDEERAFAVQRAHFILQELKEFEISSNDRKGFLTALDAYDDGDQTSLVLSIAFNATPESTMNPDRKYKRKVRVSPVANEPNLRQVEVAIYLARNDTRLARVGALVKNPALPPAPTQVYDVYVLDPQNVPSAFPISKAHLKLAQAVLKNPGLEIRLSHINRLAHGRDPYYRPSDNHVYRYWPIGWSFDPLVGKRIYLGVFKDGDGHSLADEMNHGQRYPDEWRLHQQALADAQARGTAPPVPTWRVLLEKMLSGDPSVKNIAILSAYGSALIVPPMRNYSDAAKDPATHPGVRVVTHPEKLKTPATDNVKLRVHAYTMSPGTTAPGAETAAITVRVQGSGVTAAALTSLKKMDGGESAPYAWRAAVPADYSLVNEAGGVRLVLRNTPLRHPPAPDGTGLDPARRLQGLEYIPCPVSAAFHTGPDLSAIGPGPKNTARWLLEWDRHQLSAGVVTIETTIGEGDPGPACNLSRTYAWFNTDPPHTERYQWMGDPRHLPYEDVKADHGYNWYFARVDPASGYSGFDRTADGYLSPDHQLAINTPVPNYQNVDVPRYFQLVRHALLNSNAVFHSGYNTADLKLFAFGSYILMGGELVRSDFFSICPDGLYAPGVSGGCGSEWNPPGNGVPITGLYKRVVASADNGWVARPWLGELYPDSAFDRWSALGNLSIGDGFYRARYSTFQSVWGHAQPRDFAAGRIDRGGAHFLNGKSVSAVGDPYFQIFPNGTTNYDFSQTNEGHQLGNQFGVIYNKFNEQHKVFATSGFRLDYSSTTPTGYNEPEYSGQRLTLSLSERFLSGVGSGPLPSAPHNFVNVMGIVMARDPLNSLRAFSFFNSGVGAHDLGDVLTHMAQETVWTILRSCENSHFPAEGRPPPLLTLSSPVEGDLENPGAVTIAWSTEWVRFDREPYTPAFSAGWSPAGGSMRMNAKYSTDNGATWKFVNSGAAALAGTYDPTRQVTSPLTWNMGSLPAGNCILRVEAFSDRPMHYAYHQVRLLIKR